MTPFWPQVGKNSFDTFRTFHSQLSLSFSRFFLLSWTSDIVHGHKYLTVDTKHYPTRAPGGAISNMYAVIVARHKMFPEYKEKGLKSLPQLVLYTSEHVSARARFLFCFRASIRFVRGEAKEETTPTFNYLFPVKQFILFFVSLPLPEPLLDEGSRSHDGSWNR